MVNKNLIIGVVILGVFIVGVSFLMPGLSKDGVEGTTSTIPSAGELSDFQIAACNAADEGGTCDTKLSQFELVTKEECCEHLGKCC